MKNLKANVIIKSILWSILILLFPLISGVLSAILSLDTIKTLFLQGCFMLTSVVLPLIMVLCGKFNWREIGFDKFDTKNCRLVLYFLPVLIMFIPAMIKGFYIKSTGYVLGSLFLYLAVGFAEEIYFRGIIPYYLKKVFSTKQIIIISTLIFGFGHMAVAFSGTNVFEVVITVINAIIFGWMAIEIAILSKNIIPTIVIHFLFDFETKIVVMQGNELLIAEGIRGCIMFFIALWLMLVIRKMSKTKVVGKNIV